MDTDLTNLAADEGIADVPRDAIAPRSTSASAAYRLIHGELALDGAARLNLATFVTTWMEPEATQLVTESLDKNLVDKDEYPQTAEFERRCTHMLADLWHAPDPGASPGCSTTGSSEACMLGGLALLRRWRTRRGDGAGRPNLVMGANVQVCWEKFCAYWDVEARLVPVGDGATHLVADRAVGALRREHDRRRRDPRLDLRRDLRAGGRDRRRARRARRRRRA